MAKKKIKKINFKAPATRGDVEDLALLTNKHFIKANKRMDNMATKQDLNQLVTKDEARQFVTKNDLAEHARKQEEYKEEIINAFKAQTEAQKADIEAAHKDEMAAVEGKVPVPTQWQSIPRRINALEFKVEKIEDKLYVPPK